MFIAQNIIRITQENKYNINNRKNKKEWKLITDIKNKVSTNKLTITKAGKGKTIVIFTQEEYKINNFIQDKLTVMNNNTTQHYQKTIKQTLKQCNIIIQKETICL
jgi:hypothetical protein